MNWAVLRGTLVTSPTRRHDVEPDSAAMRRMRRPWPVPIANLLTRLIHPEVQDHQQDVRDQTDDHDRQDHAPADSERIQRRAAIAFGAGCRSR